MSKLSTAILLGIAFGVAFTCAAEPRCDSHNCRYIQASAGAYLRVYVVTVGDADALVKKLEAKYRGSESTVRVRALGTKEIMVYAPPALQEEIKKFVQSVPPTLLELTPATEPRPALKFPLLPELRDQIPHNAALWYQRALLRLRDRKERLPEKVDEWLTVPLAEIDKSTVFSRAKARRLADEHAVWEAVSNASRCSRCDWEPNPDLGVASSSAIPDLRELARFLALSARVDILDGNFDRALRTIKHGITLARNVGHAPEVIGTLQGVGIASLFLTCLEDLAQSPGSPNLFWSLTALPQPLIPWRNAAQGERSSLLKDFPELRGLEAKPMPEKEVAARLARVMGRLELFAGAVKEADVEAVEMLLAAAAKQFHKAAIERLLSAGFKKELVGALPAVQTVALSAIVKYQEIEDDHYKLAHLPFWEAWPRIKQLDAEVKKYRASAEASVPALLLMQPNFHKSCLATTRIERRLAALRCIEAVRLYAAEHDGELPKKLAEIKSMPVPLDPYTGKAFEYTLSMGRALLYGPPLPDEPPVKDDNVICYWLMVKR